MVRVSLLFHLLLVVIFSANGSPLVNEMTSEKNSETVEGTLVDSNSTQSDPSHASSHNNNNNNTGLDGDKEIKDMDNAIDQLKEGKQDKSTSRAPNTTITVPHNEVTIPIIKNSTGTKDNSAIKTTEPAPNESHILTNNLTTQSSSTPPTTASSAAPKTTHSSATLQTTQSSAALQTTEAKLNGSHDEDGIKSYFLSKFTFWKDDFLLSIIEPIVIGLGTAILILTIIYCVKWSKNTYIARKRMSFTKPKMAGDIRKMKQSDRIKLLAASSDDEF